MTVRRSHRRTLMAGGVVLLVAGTALQLSPMWTAGMIAVLAGAILALREVDRRIPRHSQGADNRILRHRQDAGPPGPRAADPGYRQGPPPPRR